MGRIAGWHGAVAAFIDEDRLAIQLALEEFIHDAGESQKRAWKDSIRIMQGVLSAVKEEGGRGTPVIDQDGAILEYMLPMEGGRRPDMIVIENGCVLILEFKGKLSYDRADLDQALGYKRDLSAYHSVLHDGVHPVNAVLVLTRRVASPELNDGVYVCGPEHLPSLIVELTLDSTAPSLSSTHFLEGTYLPLPSLVKAAKLHFKEADLPHIRRASSNTDPAFNRIRALVKEAAEHGTRKLVLLSGVPGSGKSLVGIRLSYEAEFKDLGTERLIPSSNNSYRSVTPENPSIFLSGNGPLVAVLKNALGRGSSGFIQDVRKYVLQYGSESARAPPHHVVIFDEAQRAWDADKVERKHQGKHGVAGSEPEIFLSLANRIPDWSVMIGLIGNGQEIHDGEESGLQQWIDAMYQLDRKQEWMLHAPPGIMSGLSISGVESVLEPLLSLNTTIRSHFAETLHLWVDQVLSAPTDDYSEIQKMYKDVKSAGFRIYMTDSLQKGKMYTWNRYENHPEARYGLIKSSRDKSLDQYGVAGLKWPKTPNYGKWYNNPLDEGSSCCQLDLAFTEFDTQGLELDFTILGWGNDLILENGRWSNRFAKRYAHTSKIQDAMNLRINAYRVLLTRARDGFIIFIPKSEQMTETVEHLRSCGIESL